MRNLRSYIVFFSIIIGLFFFYGFQHILFYPPCSFHMWRQTDGLSLATVYYQQGQSLFEPKLQNLLGDDGKTVGEFPLIYFCVAKLYYIFGENEWVFRAFCLTIYYLGLFFLFRLCLRLFQGDIFWASSIIVIAFTSPIVVYYSCNFLPDVPSLGLCFGFWYFFYEYSQTKKILYLLWAILLISLAGLLKINGLVSYSALIIAMSWDLFSNKKKSILYQWGFFPVSLLSIPFVLIGLWVLFVHDYQTKSQNFYFLQTILPIWNLPKDTILFIYKRLSQNWGWYPDIYRQNILLFALMSLGLLVFAKPMIRKFTVCLMGVILSFMLLFYEQLNHHDYYLINLLILIVYIYIFAIFHIQKMLPWIEDLAKMGMAIILFLAIIHTQERIDRRYHDYDKEVLLLLREMGQEPLNKLGITSDKKIIFTGYGQYVGPLYLLKRYGWSDYISNIQDSTLAYYRSKGASFVVYYNHEHKEMSPKYSQMDSIGNYKELVYFYKLR